MFKRWTLLSVVILLLVVTAAPGLAQGPIRPQHSDPTWTAKYWNNMTLSGTPVVTREEDNVNHDWGTGSPAPEVTADTFSTRWTRYVDVTPGTYRFTVTSDDGVRLWVDNQLIIDKWYDHAAESYTAEHYLGSGHHLIKVEYYENRGLAVAKLSWTEVGQDPTPSGPWKAEYWNNLTLSGTPALVRNEQSIDHNWGTGSPEPGTVNADHFSARWTRTFNADGDMYTFRLTTDDGARLWVNGHLLIDAWYQQAPTTYTGEIYLEGEVTAELQYFEQTGLAVAQLSWTTEGDEPGPGPAPSAVIVDDLDPGFMRGGTAAGWRTANEGYDGHLHWTYNNDRARSNYNWARWYPTLAAGTYEVFVYVPDRYTTTSQARYWVVHNGRYTLKIVNQSTRGGQWVSLGTYYFAGGGGEYVSLADVTYEPYASHLIGFDAVKWEPR